jgi:hypothetical protein
LAGVVRLAIHVACAVDFQEHGPSLMPLLSY